MLYQPTPIPEVDPAAPADVQLKLGDFNLALSPFTNLSFIAFLSGGLRWSDIGISPAALSDARCVVPADVTDADHTGANTMIFEADIRGCPLESTPLLSKTVGDIAPSRLSDAIFPGITLKDSIVYDRSKLNVLKISDIPVANRDLVVDCAALAAAVGGFDCAATPGTLTLGDPAVVPKLRTGFEGPTYGLYSSLGSALNGLSLSEIVLSLIPREALPWSDFEPTDISVQGFGNAAHFLDYRLTLDAACSNSAGLSAMLTPHGGFRYVPGSGRLGGETPIEPTLGEGGSFTFALPSCSDGTTSPTLDFQLMPGFTLGDFGVDVSVSSSTVPAVQLPNQAVIHVVENNETGNTPADAFNGSTGVLYLGQITQSGDVDSIAIDVPPGKLLSVSLNVPAGEDLDLALYAPLGSHGGQRKLVPGAAADLNFGKLPLAAAGFQTGGILRPEMGQEIPLDPTRPIAGVSAFRNSDTEFIQTTAVAGNEGARYVLQINGHDGAHGPHTYVAFSSTSDPVTLPECSPTGRVFPYAGQASVSPGSAPAVDGADTLIVVDQQRMRDAYGATGYTSVMNAISSFISAHPGGVNARLLPVDAFADVRSAFATLDTGGNRCDPEKINDVVATITGKIATYRGSAQNIVIAGSDEVLPFARLLDKTVNENEAGYTGDTLLDSNTDPGITDANNALAGSLGRSYFLSDNPYGTIIPLSIFGDYVYLPQLSVGRIGERAADITAQFDQFRVANGMADPRTLNTDPRKVLETDYDFLTDGGAQQYDAFVSQVGAANVTRLTGPSWNRADFENDLVGGTPPYVASINAHFDHHSALPSIGNTTNSSADLFTSDRLTPAPSLAKRVYFSIGCHFALNVDDQLGAGLLPGGDLASRTATFDQSTLNDWTEAFARKGAAAVVGNLGYGIGDIAGVGYSESLMANFARNLDGSVTLGRGLRDAKRDYWLSMGSYTPEDVKVVQQAVMWGFPMYKVPAAPGVVAAAAVTPIASTAADPISGIATTTQFELTPSFTTKNATGGRQYVSADDGTQNTAPYPIMPKVLTSFPAIAGKKPVFFAPLDVASFTDSAILQAFSHPVTDSSTDPTVPGDVAYPAVLQNITTAVGLSGDTYKGVIIPAQYFPGPDSSGPGTIRKLTDSRWMVWYADASVPVPAQPLVSSVDATQIGADTAIVVNAVNPTGLSADDVVRVYALVQRTGQNSFVHVELSKGTGNRWTGGIAVNDAARIDVYAITKSGGGASATFKGIGYPVSPAPATPDVPAGESLKVKDGTLTASGWYRGTPRGYVDDGSGATDPNFKISVDGGPAQTAPAAITGDGFHLVQAVVSSTGDVLDGGIIVGVDNTAPAIFLTTPPAGGTGVYAPNQSVPESYTCVDGGSGIASCTDSNVGTQLATSTIGTKSFTVNGSDVAGNAAAPVSTTYKIAYGSGVTAFLPPVDAYPRYDANSKLIVNSAKTTQAIPFKWGIVDANGSAWPGLDSTKTTYTWTAQASSVCSGTGTVSDPVPADVATVASNSLVYDPTTGKYQWNIKKGGSTGCFLFTLTLDDGSKYKALFTFK
ncbi:MAG: PxKF domain-containing protein [Actinomycetota bacterium]